MLENYRIRTDLALEATERFREEKVEIRGVAVRENYDEERDIRTTVVKIETENGAKAMGRPQGTYIPICLFRMRTTTGRSHRRLHIICGSFCTCRRRLRFLWWDWETVRSRQTLWGRM